MHKLCLYLQRQALASNLLLLGALFAIMALVIMPAAVNDLKMDSGGLAPLDVEWHYGPQTAMDRVKAYGESGRERYLFIALTADLVYPLVYALFLCLLSARMWQGMQRGLSSHTVLPNWTSCLVMLPLLISLFDLLENAAIIQLLYTYPEEHVAVAQAAGIFTTFKWICAGMTGLLLAILALLWVVQRFTMLSRRHL